MTLFQFGDYEADDSKFELRCDGRAVRVQRIVLETLFFLIKAEGRAVSKTELLRGPWRGHKVSDAAVSRAVMLARRALADVSGSVIVTVHGLGYRFVAPPARMPALQLERGEQGPREEAMPGGKSSIGRDDQQREARAAQRSSSGSGCWSLRGRPGPRSSRKSWWVNTNRSRS